MLFTAKLETRDLRRYEAKQKDANTYQPWKWKWSSIENLTSSKTLLQRLFFKDSSSKTLLQRLFFKDSSSKTLLQRLFFKDSSSKDNLAAAHTSR
jgi:hypothetical protein